MSLPAPSAFTRYAVYACIALAKVTALFVMSLRVGRTLRTRQYAPEWQ